jgi:hypothetical protein
MIEIRVGVDFEKVIVDRFAKPDPVVWVPQHSSWSDLEVKLSDHLTEVELEIAQKIWCEDSFPRTFETGDGFVAIRPITGNATLKLHPKP